MQLHTTGRQQAEHLVICHRAQLPLIFRYYPTFSAAQDRVAARFTVYLLVMSQSLNYRCQGDQKEVRGFCITNPLLGSS